MDQASRPLPAADGAGPEIVALYREARAATAPDFKAWAMARSRRLLPLHSTHWVNGVMTERGAVFHHVSTEGLRAGYWEHFQTLMPIDPVGPRMFASPGTSLVLGYDDFPPRIRDEIMVAYDVAKCVLGMAADPSTGTFSVVCWYRDPSMPDFTEADRVLHEQLLPHWVEGLNLHRVGRVLRDLQAAVVLGSLVALVESTGLIHYAQLGFGELLAEEFPGWPGTSLPLPLLDGLRRSAFHEGASLRASWRPAPQALWMVHATRRRPSQQRAHDQARDAEVQLLNASLAASERELDAARRALHERDKQEAVLQERQRILRDLHDGVGAHLVGLRSLLQAGATVNGDMAEALDSALDEMRLAVDSMQAAEGDLGEALAALRWRLQPRFDAAGITLHWAMPDPDTTAAACAGLPAGAVLQVQRILLEALTNVLKHSKATAVSVGFEARPAPHRGWQLNLRDDGVGWPEPTVSGGAMPGVGMRSMAQRAAGIGARLELGPGTDSNRGRGTELRLSWPAPPSA